MPTRLAALSACRTPAEVDALLGDGDRSHPCPVTAHLMAGGEFERVTVGADYVTVVPHLGAWRRVELPAAVAQWLRAWDADWDAVMAEP